MGEHERDKGRDGDGRWTKPVPPQPEPGKHDKPDPGSHETPDPRDPHQQ